MVRYILTKIDDSVIKDKRFFNGKTKKFFGNKSVVLIKEELKFLQEESLNYDSDFILAKKLRGVLE